MRAKAGLCLSREVTRFVLRSKPGVDWAITWVGGAVAVQVFGILTKRAADSAKTVFFIRNVAWVVTRMFLPAALLVFVSGVGLLETGFWDWDDDCRAVTLKSQVEPYCSRRHGNHPPLMLRIRNLVWTSRALLAALVLIVFVMTTNLGT